MEQFSTISYDIEKIEDDMLKQKLLSQYLKNFCKLNYPESEIIFNRLSNHEDIINLSVYNKVFDELSLNKIEQIFKVVPTIKPDKLYFITRKLNNKLIYYNHSMYTDIIFDNEEPILENNFIDFLVFNKFIERIEYELLKSIVI